MSAPRADIPRREEIEALFARGMANGAIAAALSVPHREVARLRKIVREREHRAQHGPRLISEAARERRRAHDRDVAQERTDKRHAQRAAALAEESAYRKTAQMRKIRVMEMIAEGKTVAEMARALRVGSSTVTQIVAALQGKRQWARRAAVTVLMDHAIRDRIRARSGAGQVSGWVLGLIVAELDRLDAGGQ